MAGETEEPTRSIGAPRESYKTGNTEPLKGNASSDPRMSVPDLQGEGMANITEEPCSREVGANGDNDSATDPTTRQKPGELPTPRKVAAHSPVVRLKVAPTNQTQARTIDEESRMLSASAKRILEAEEANKQSFHVSGPARVAVESGEVPLASSHSRAKIEIDESGQAFISTLKTTQPQLSYGVGSETGGQNMLNVPSTMVIDNSKTQLLPGGDSRTPF